MDKLKQVAEGYRDYSEGHGPLAVYLLVAVGVVAGLVLLGWAVQRALVAQERAGRRRAFRRFADASGLTEEEEGFMMRLAERAELENRARIFVERTLFEAGAPALGWERERLDVLRSKVYGP